MITPGEERPELQMNTTAEFVKAGGGERKMYGKGDFGKMRDMLDIVWEEEFKNYKNDVELQWTAFLDKLRMAEKQCIPTKRGFARRRGTGIPLDKKLWTKI